MATKEQLLEEFRKAYEDLSTAKDRERYKAKYGEEVLSVGANVITLPLADDTAYATADEYEITFHEALDTEGTDIKMGLIISDKTALSFTVTSEYEGSLKWTTFLKVPNFYFFT